MSRTKKNDPRQPSDKDDLPPIPRRDPIEPDPMNPVPTPADAEPSPAERPDLDWAEHED
jgi:hypothetical protein